MCHVQSMIVWCVMCSPWRPIRKLTSYCKRVHVSVIVCASFPPSLQGWSLEVERPPHNPLPWHNHAHTHICICITYCRDTLMHTVHCTLWTRSHTHTHSLSHTHTHTHTHTHVRICMWWTYMYSCTRLRTYNILNMYLFTYACTKICVLAWSHTHINITHVRKDVKHI